MRSCSARLAIFLGLLFPISLPAQQTFTVKNFNDYYDPQSTTVHQGDTVIIENPRSLPLTHQHDLNFVNNAFPGRGFGGQWTYEVTFENVGEYGFFCSRHGEQGMVTVQAGSSGGGDPEFEIEPGHNGNWWHGPSRDGEGVQIEISESSDGSMVLVATIYSYAPSGGQIFMIAVGTPDGDTADVDIFITEGGTWGAEFDPADVTQKQWGTGEFKSLSCDSMRMELIPNNNHLASGYTSLTYELVRLTTPFGGCQQ